MLPGQRIAVDGVIVSGETGVNESMLTGEQDAVRKSLGHEVYAGTVKINPLTSKSPPSEPINGSTRWCACKQAAAQKPKIAEFADKVAQYFVPILLVLAVITYLAWLQLEPEHALGHAFGIGGHLPCALALATPAALTCGTNR